MNANYKSIIFAISLFFASSVSIPGAPGDLDPTFGSGGIVITNGGVSLHLYYAWAMAIQSDGKIIVVGEGATPPFDAYNWDFAVVRYNPDGTLDSSFGGSGIVITPVGGIFDQPTSVAIQKDGKIVVAGSGDGSTRSFALVRYNTDGSLDASFNGTGKVITPVGTFGEAHSVAIQADGKIVVAGISGDGSTLSFALVRYNTDGSLDASFNGTGKVITPGGGATSVAIQSDGKIIAAGESRDGTNPALTLVRYNANGTPDTSFNGTGKVITSVGNSGSGASDLAIQIDGKIVAAGFSLAAADWRTADYTLVRYNPDGSLDTSFGGTGKIVIPDSDLDYANSVAIQSNGKIVVAGSRGNIAYKSAVVRVNTNGSLDTSFNGTGIVLTSYGVANDHASSVAIQADGKIVVAGDTGPDEFKDFVVARYLGDAATPTPTPTPTPTVTPTPTPTPTLTPTPTPTLRVNGKIAFTSDRDGNREIYVMNADGTNQVRLTNNSIIDDHPTWSPDGTKIAFVSQRPSRAFAIFQMNADGTNKTEITPINFDATFPIEDEDGWSMSWSPDGNRIVFQEKPDPSAFPNDIFIVNKDGSNRHVLVNDPEDERQPAWSPDGSKILFSKQVSDFSNNLFTVKPDGTDLKALASVILESDSAPAWSPTGNMIAFQIWDYANFVSVGIANPDGSNRVWFDNGASTPDHGHRGKPQWAPDGSKIIFQSTRDDIGTEIYVKNLDGTGLIQLTNTTGSNFKPSWQGLASISCPNPIDCPDFFVRQQYLDFLGREPDSIGFANWMATLTSCPNGGYGEFDNPHCDRIHVSAGFVQSHEFQGRGYWILRFGFVGLNRSIGSVRSSATNAEFTPALAQVGGSNSPAQEEAAKVTYANAFVQRSDFLALFPATMTATQYINALESNAQVTLPNKQALVDAMNDGTMTRADVLRNVVESQVVFDKYIIPAFVTMEYFGYLRRDPDLIGYQNWVNTLTADPNNYRHMIFGFIYSIEYRQRFGPP